MLVSQVANVQDFHATLGEKQEANNIHVFDQRAANVINLPSVIFAVAVRQKSYYLKAAGSRGEAQELTRWIAPNGMEFCLDKYTGPLPYCPPNNLFTAVARGVLWNDDKAFVLWLTEQWLASHCDWLLSRANAVAELDNMRRGGSGRGEHLMPSNA